MPKPATNLGPGWFPACALFFSFSSYGYYKSAYAQQLVQQLGHELHGSETSQEISPCPISPARSRVCSSLLMESYRDEEERGQSEEKNAGHMQ